MTIEMVKTRALCLLMIAALTGIIYSSYTTIIGDVLDIVNNTDYIFFDPKQFPVLFLLPVLVLLDLFFVFGFFAFIPRVKRMMNAVTERFIIPVTVYGILALFLGIVVSMIVSVYPLGIHYYQCDSTSIISSGSHYGKTKEICKQRAYSKEANSLE